MTDYFVNFAPADAVQYDPAWGSRAATKALNEFTGGLCVAPARKCVRVMFSEGDDLILPGQWLVHQGGESWVQDDEPARVERWEHHTHVHICQDGHCPGDVRYPVLSNGWTGPWIPVEGGAE